MTVRKSLDKWQSETWKLNPRNADYSLLSPVLGIDSRLHDSTHFQI